MSYEKHIFDMAEAELNQRRFDAENEYRKRMQEIEVKIPDIKEIYIQLSQTNIELSKLIISKKGNFQENFNKIKEQNLHGQALARELLIGNGYPADYLDLHYFCNLCNDKGYSNGIRCECFTHLLNKYAVEKLNETANMPDCDFEHFSLDYYKNVTCTSGQDSYKKMSEILAYCKQYAASFSTASPSIFMYGKTGIGKTHLSLSIGKKAAEKGYNVAYGSLINFLSSIEKEHFGKAENNGSDTMNLLIDCDLLIIDDLGSEFYTGFYESILYNIINSRINLSRPTIINTNLSLEELQNKYNDRIISRIFGIYNMLYFIGDDIRSIKKYSR